MPGQVNVGGNTSTVVALNEQVLVFPEASVAVNVTVRPKGVTVVPAAGDCVTVGLGSQLSDTVAKPV